MCPWLIFTVVLAGACAGVSPRPLLLSFAVHPASLLAGWLLRISSKHRPLRRTVLDSGCHLAQHRIRNHLLKASVRGHGPCQLQKRTTGEAVLDKGVSGASVFGEVLACVSLFSCFPSVVWSTTKLHDSTWQTKTKTPPQPPTSTAARAAESARPTRQQANTQTIKQQSNMKSCPASQSTNTQPQQPQYYAQEHKIATSSAGCTENSNSVVVTLCDRLCQASSRRVKRSPGVRLVIVQFVEGFF